jgi:hypothetical protein
MSYEKKYLKYKTKYLELSKLNIQEGAATATNDTDTLNNQKLNELISIIKKNDVKKQKETLDKFETVFRDIDATFLKKINTSGEYKQLGTNYVVIFSLILEFNKVSLFQIVNKNIIQHHKKIVTNKDIIHFLLNTFKPGFHLSPEMVKALTESKLLRQNVILTDEINELFKSNIRFKGFYIYINICKYINIDWLLNKNFINMSRLITNYEEKKYITMYEQEMTKSKKLPKSIKQIFTFFYMFEKNIGSDRILDRETHVEKWCYFLIQARSVSGIGSATSEYFIILFKYNETTEKNIQKTYQDSRIGSERTFFTYKGPYLLKDDEVRILETNFFLPPSVCLNSDS